MLTGSVSLTFVPAAQGGVGEECHPLHATLSNGGKSNCMEVFIDLVCTAHP